MMAPWKFRADRFRFATEIVMNIDGCAVSILNRTPKAFSVNMTAGIAPFDTSWDFLPIRTSVTRKSMARHDGTKRRSGRKIS